MNIVRLAKSILLIAVIIGAAAVGYLTRGMWTERPNPADLPASAPASDEEASDGVALSENKIIVGDQAQKNLGLKAKRLLTEVFWKTVTIQGMIVDRPGFSDREIVAPTTGIVTRLLHLPGDMVRPGDALFTLRIASESMQQTQTDLFKASQDIKLAEAQRERLIAGGEGIPRARVIEVENAIARLQAVVQGYRQELLTRGLSPEEVEGVAHGKLVTDITLYVPPISLPPVSFGPSPGAGEQPLAYELEELEVELGEQVQAGQTLCNLSNHQSLAVEGRAFRDETSLLERSVQEGWPVEVDFQEDDVSAWPPIEQSFHICYMSNSIDPVTRTFAFLVPLENQFKAVEHHDREQLLWRFRPGQKVLLRIRVEKLEDVFVLPADAVVFEGPEAFIFTQNVNTFERKGVHVLYRDRDRVVIANDGALQSYARGEQHATIAAVAQSAAAQLNRMTKSGSSGVPKGYHIHADGSLHKNESITE